MVAGRKPLSLAYRGQEVLRIRRWSEIRATLAAQTSDSEVSDNNIFPVRYLLRLILKCVGPPKKSFNDTIILFFYY